MEGGREEPFRVERWMLFLPCVLSLSKWASHSFFPNHVIILAEARIKSPSTLLSFMKDGSTSRQMGKCLPNARGNLSSATQKPHKKLGPGTHTCNPVVVTQEVDIGRFLAAQRPASLVYVWQTCTPRHLAKGAWELKPKGVLLISNCVPCTHTSTHTLMHACT